MSTSVVVALILALYLGLNFVCALVLHLHAERQAHLPVRFLDVLVHFVLLTAFAVPVLLVVSVEAMFGSKDQPGLSTAEVSPAAARAA